MRTCILLILLLPGLAPSAARAQFGTVTGRIIDAHTTEPLAGANVTIESGQERRGTATDELGRFTLTNVRPGAIVLLASHVGYAPFSDTLEIAFDQIVAVRVPLVASTEGLDEVVVEAGDAPPTPTAGHVQVGAAELERVPLPDVSGDLASFLLTRPGVVAAGDRGGQLFIRGGTPAQNLVLLDGMRVYQPFHIVGFYSVFPADLVARADVYAGGFGAKYGGRISSVVDVRTLNGSKRRLTGSASLAPFLASVRASIPFVPGSVSLVASARESIIERIAPSFLGRELPYRFGDRFLKMHAFLGRTSSLSATLLHGFDKGSIAGTSGDDRFSIWENTSFGGRYTYLHPETAIITEIEAHGTRYASRFAPSEGEERSSFITSYHGEMHFAYLLGRVDVHFGMFGATYLTDYDLGEGHPDVSESVTEAGIYAYMPWDITEELHVEPGIRIQTFTNGIGTAVEPRFRASLSPGGILEGQHLNAAWGIYHQQLLGLNNQRDVTDAFFAWAPNPRFAPLPRSTHVMVGTSRPVLPFLRLSAEAYRRTIDHVSFALFGDVPGAPAPLQRVDGAARGLDLTAELTRPGLYLYAGYSLSSVTYRYVLERSLVRPDAGGDLQTLVQRTLERFSPPHDRRHQINVIAQLSTGPYEFTARWHLGSGLPFTPIYGYYELPEPDPNRTQATATGERRASYADAYSKRLPTYHRLDVTAERSFAFDAWELTMHAGVVNLYDRANIFSYDLLLNRRVDQLPIIPTIGLKIELDD